MSIDVAVAQFDGETTAVKKYAEAKERSRDAAWTQKVGFVERHHSGRILIRGTFAGHYVDVDEVDVTSEQGMREGAATGGLIGVLGGPPGIAVGLLLGGIVGLEVGPNREGEAEPEALAERLRDAVPKSSSAIVLIAPASDVDEMIAALGDGVHGITRRTLTNEEEAALQASLADAPAASSEF